MILLSVWAGRHTMYYYRRVKPDLKQNDGALIRMMGIGLRASLTVFLLAIAVALLLNLS
ncbi:hypothetical protein [Lacticaseibacillus camelliae]|nr:hypothetical protein [Lacticaseibacillus camelliae]